jgi:hypothetical protein
MPSHEGQICKSTPGGGASQFRELSPFRRLMSHPDFGAPRPGREHNHQVCWDQVSHI